MKRLILFIFTIFSLGCSYKSVTPVLIANDLFPTGVYHQNIQVTYLLEGKKQSASFQAILKKTESEFSMYAFVGFGMSLFKIRELQNKPLQFETSEPRILEKKEFFLKIFPLIKKIFALQKKDITDKNLPLKFYQEDVPIKVDFPNYRVGSMPLQIYIFDDKNFRFEVTTNKYEAVQK